jgi:hypothetical protein
VLSPFSPTSPQSPAIGLPVHLLAWFGHVDVAIVRVATPPVSPIASA